jgi:8-oxo-dGTP diphosphatase
VDESDDPAGSRSSDPAGSRLIDTAWAERYPDLFRPHPHTWDGVRRDYALQLTLVPPADDLVVNVRLVAVDEEGRVVVCETVEGWRTLPGGSRERGESVQEAAERELHEEAGHEVTGPITWFASFTVTGNTRPWRDWHPHPVSAWAVGTASAHRVGAPTNPADGEVVVRVQALQVDDAVAYLDGFDNGGQAQLVALARDLGLLSRPG